MTEQAKVYGPPRIALDTALRLKVNERALVDRTYTARPDPVLASFRQFHCRRCGRMAFLIQTTDATRHSARALVTHAEAHQVDQQP
jgi:hypothetical protein